MSIAAVKDYIMNAKSVKKQSPEPLRKQSAKAIDFPVELLPPIIRNAILGLHCKIQAPIAICAQSVLASVNLALQGHSDIELPIGQTRPISCLFLTIAQSGERKTSCDNEITKYIEQHEEKLREKYKSEYKDWKNSFDAWDKQRTQILTDKSKYPNRTSKESALNFLGDPPISPLDPTLICSEPTYEGLCKLMAVGQPSIGIFSSEGGQFLYGYSMKNENKLKTAAALSDLWDGKSIKRIRSGDGVMTLIGRRLCMHLMIQPNIAADFLSDSELREQGLLSRILAVSPDSTIGTRFYRDISEINTEAISAFGSRLLEIFNYPVAVKDNCHNELTPKVITFSSTSKELFLEFADSVEKRMLPRGEFESIRGLANKLPEHAARIATTFCLFIDINTTILTDNYLKMGIDLAQYYAQEALRFLSDGTTQDNKILLAEKLLDWLHNNWTEEFVSLPNIYQNLSALSTKSKALEIVNILTDHGWLEKSKESKIINNQMRRDVWKIIREES